MDAPHFLCIGTQRQTKFGLLARANATTTTDSNRQIRNHVTNLAGIRQSLGQISFSLFLKEYFPSCGRFRNLGTNCGGVTGFPICVSHYLYYYVRWEYPLSFVWCYALKSHCFKSLGNWRELCPSFDGLQSFSRGLRLYSLSVRRPRNDETWDLARICSTK